MKLHVKIAALSLAALAACSEKKAVTPPPEAPPSFADFSFARFTPLLDGGGYVVGGPHGTAGPAELWFVSEGSAEPVLDAEGESVVWMGYEVEVTPMLEGGAYLCAGDDGNKKGLWKLTASKATRIIERKGSTPPSGEVKKVERAGAASGENQRLRFLFLAESAKRNALVRQAYQQGVEAGQESMLEATDNEDREDEYR